MRRRVDRRYSAAIAAVHVWRNRVVGVGALAVAGMLLAAASAQAATYTVGSPLTASFSPTDASFAEEFINSALPESGANVLSPVTGVIVRWRITGASGGPFNLRVLTPDGGITYTGAITSAPQTPASTATQTFATNMPIHAGQTIGINIANGSEQIGVATPTGASFGVWSPPLADGATAAVMLFGPNVELGFNADVVAQPRVSSLAPSSGPELGSTPVTITGHDFSGATAVSFGGVPAASFAVNSDTSITAVSPAASAGAVDVTVTTAGGQSPATSADQFTFLPKPSVSLITPSRAPGTGGTTVSIAGAGFTGASAVSFGGVPAASFAVNSDTSITAVSPAARPGPVDVTVTTSGGQSLPVAGDHFRFNRVCVVPKLKGKKLKATKRALRNADCRLGKVLPKGHQAGRVKHQSRTVGKVLPAGSKVNVKVG
jgi:IPT/TIG domain